MYTKHPRPDVENARQCRNISSNPSSFTPYHLAAARSSLAASRVASSDCCLLVKTRSGAQGLAAATIPPPPLPPRALRGLGPVFVTPTHHRRAASATLSTIHQQRSPHHIARTGKERNVFRTAVSGFLRTRLLLLLLRRMLSRRISHFPPTKKARPRDPLPLTQQPWSVEPSVPADPGTSPSTPHGPVPALSRRCPARSPTSTRFKQPTWPPPYGHPSPFRREQRTG